MISIYVAQWWMNYGESAPHLKRLAIRILSQTTSSSSCERNWSTFALVHTKQRNRMSQKKVERNVFIHYNVRFRLKNMKRSRNQGEQGEYCPINLDYIFAEDDPLLPWLENREKEIDNMNSEDENYNYSNVVRRTTQTHQENIIELDEDSSATHTDNAEDTRDDDDDDDDDDGDSGGGGREPQIGGGGMSESFVPDTYPYPYVSQSQDTVKDRGKSPIIEEEEDETHEEEEDDEELSRMDSIQRQSPWPTGNPNIYAQPFSPQYTPQPPPIGADSYVYIFGYPSQYGYGYGQSSNDHNNNDNNVEELPRHSFWW